MCIRDRVKPTRPEKRWIEYVGAIGGGKNNDILSFFKAIHFCLLYTSDAADERSSVDLGGRRIIKKKTKRDHEMHSNMR